MNLKLFDKYNKIISMTFNSQSPDTESLLLSFKDGYAYFNNESMRGRVKIEKKDDIDDLCVIKNQFLVLSKLHNEIEIKDDVFYYGKNNFNFKKEMVDIEKVEIDKTKLKLLENFNTDENYKIIQEASNFISINGAYNGLFIKNRILCSSDNECLYIRRFSFDEKFIINNTFLKILKYFNQIKTNLPYKVYYYEDDIRTINKKFVISIDNEIDIIINVNNELQSPPIDDPGVISRMNIDSYILCNSKDLLVSGNQLKSFGKLLVLIKIIDNQLSISFLDDIKVEQFVELKNKHNIEDDFEFCVDLEKLVLILKSLENEDFITIKVSKDSDFAIFSNSENNLKKITLSKYE